MVRSKMATTFGRFGIKVELRNCEPVRISFSAAKNGDDLRPRIATPK